MQVAIDPNEYMAEVYTSDMQLKANLSLGEGRHGSGSGQPSLGTAAGQSVAQLSDGDGSPIAASDEENREEARDLIELLKVKGVEVGEAVILRMSKEEREVLLKLLG